MAEHENNVPETQGTSRRTLLAKAAAAGAVVYAAPVVSSIPAYAAGGLTSYNVSKSGNCVWFTPAQNKWKAETLGNPTAANPLTVQVSVDSVNRPIRFSGSPVNQSGPNGYGANGTGSYWYGDAGTADGEGAFIECLDTNCEIVIEGVYIDKLDKASTCTTPDTTYSPTSWALGSSDSPINSGATAPNGNIGAFQTAYYHSGCQGPGGSKKAVIGFKFTVRCK